ncbi:MAG TPA: coiled-coil domain-containing protein [Amaricoccus sp.]|nr:coiled-coil domain-containing protein [Amaricoccus sp.]
MRIDTLTFARKLTDAGLDRKVAEAIVEGLSEADTSDLATRGDLVEVRSVLKSDIQEVRSELKSEIQEVRSELQGVRSELREEIQGVRSELQLSLSETKAELLRFMLVQALAIVGLTVTLLKVLP